MELQASSITEEIEQAPKGSIDLQKYVDLIRRKHLHFLVPLLLGWSVVWTLSWVLPPRYKSGTLILVERPTMPRDYVIPNVNEDLQDSITQQILSRTRLLLIIDAQHLYAGTGGAQMTSAEKVERMRKDINIQLVRNPQDQITAFDIYYSAGDPQTAQRVCGELAKLFINANIELRQQQSEDTTNFLRTELESARGALAAQEVKVREFQGAHVGELPAQQASNLQVLGGLQAQLVNEQDALNTAEQQRVYVQALLNQYQAMQPARRSSGADAAGPTEADVQVNQLRRDLAAAAARHTDKYPDVQALKTQLARAEADAAMRAPSPRAKAAGEANVAPADSPQNTVLVQLQSQFAANKAEISNREQTVASLKAKVEEYQRRLSQEPIREQQLADLTRGYEQSKANYDDLLKKQNESAMATSMERMKEGERFLMLDPPNLPAKPDVPNRLKFCGYGLCIGIALGLLCAVGTEMMDDRIHSEAELAKILSTPAITEIPEVVTPELDRQKHRRYAVGWATAVAVAVMVVAGTAFTLVHS